MTFGSFRAVFATAVVASVLATNAQESKRVEVDTSRLSAELVDLARLVKSGVDEQVVLKFIENTPPKRNPSADELVYLHELGLSSSAMVSLMNSVPKVSLVRPPVAAAGGPMEPMAQSAPAPAPIIVSSNAVITAPAPTVVYAQPSTVYIEQPPVVRYYEPAPRFTFGLSFGHGFGWHHGHHFGWGGHWHGHHHRRHRW